MAFEDMDHNRLGNRLRLRRLHNFWNKVDAWPSSHLGNVFLPHALGEVGEAIFKDRWKPSAIQSQLPLPSPLPSNMADARKIFDGEARWRVSGASLNEILRTALIQTGKFERTETDVGPFVPTAAEYRTARDIINAELQETAEGVRQWNSAANALVNGLQQGVLVSRLQRLAGGQYSDPLPPDAWILHDKLALVDRFIVCMMHPTAEHWTDRIEWEAWEAGVRNPITEGWQWIFVTHASLDRFLDEIKCACGQKQSEQPPPVIEAFALLPSNVGEMQRTLRRAMKFMKSNGLGRLTRTEGESLLVKLHRGVQRNRREAVKIITSDGKRRTQATLANRSKELDDCREFLATTV